MSYYERNKERVQQQHREYYQAHREGRLLYQYAYNMTYDAERKIKNRERYWAIRDKNKKAKIPPPSLNEPIAPMPVSFTTSFD